MPCCNFLWFSLKLAISEPTLFPNMAKKYKWSLHHKNAASASKGHPGKFSFGAPFSKLMQWVKQTTMVMVCTGVQTYLPTYLLQEEKNLTPSTNHSLQLQTAAARLKGLWENLCRKSSSMNLSGKNSFFSSSHPGFCSNMQSVPLHLNSCTWTPRADLCPYQVHSKKSLAALLECKS